MGIKIKNNLGSKVEIRYTNDLGNGHSGFLDYGSGIVVTTISGQPIEVTSTSSGVVNVQPVGVSIDAFGTWVSAGADSAVEYNLTGTASTGGRVVAQGYFSGSNQSSAATDILKEALFKFQLERNGLVGTPYELSLLISASAATSTVHAALDWEEISR